MTGDLFDRSAAGARGWRVRGWDVQPRFADLLRLGRRRGKLPPRPPFRQTSVLSDVTATSFTLDQVWTTGTIVARAHADGGRVGNDRDLHPDLSGSGRGNRLGRERRVHRDLDSITLIPSRRRVTGVIEVTVFNKAP